MSVAEIERLLHNYRAWLRDKTTLRQVNGEWVEITTPYVGAKHFKHPFEALRIIEHGLA